MKNWTIEYVRDGLAMSTEVIANSLSAAFVASFELEEDPSVEVLDVYMSNLQGTDGKNQYFSSSKSIG
jgi:hypothetical protein